MKKFYFDMTEAEKVFSHIVHDLDWADCALSHGIMNSLENLNMDKDEFRDLYEKAENSINRAYGYVYRLLGAVQGQSEKSEDEVECPTDKQEASLSDVNDMISLISSLIRAQGSDEREVQKFVLSTYDQFGVSEEDRNLLKKIGVVKHFNSSIGKGVINGDDGQLLIFSSQCVAGENATPLEPEEIVSYIPDGCEARYIENSLHYVPDKDECDEPLIYHEVEDEAELDALKGCTLIARAREEFKFTGPGMDLTFKGGEGGARLINLLVLDDGVMYLSDWY